ncbi:uncharacterized protein [Acropora muricata]|uniref:uncharacterized protein isoform X2 n=1 Tax=Acropora muricata TaxID=159855 RepID=UPI0034E5AFAC
MVCYWLYAVIVCLKVTAFLHVSLVDAKVHPKGMEFKSWKFCGSDHSNAKIEITPWPFIANEHIFNFTFSITPETYVFRGSHVLHDFLPGLSMTIRGTVKGYNEDLYEFLCVEAVAVKS